MKRKPAKKPSAKSAAKAKSVGKKPDTTSAGRRKAASSRNKDLVREPGAAWTEAAATRENKLLGIEDGWFNNAYLVQPPPKERISIRLDRDVLEFFRSQGRGYQSRINRVLQAFVEQSKRK